MVSNCVLLVCCRLSEMRLWGCAHRFRPMYDFLTAPACTRPAFFKESRISRQRQQDPGVEVCALSADAT